MFMKMKELCWKENHGIQDIGINDTNRNIIADKETNTDHLGEFYRIL
jgi:hypothetical protein